MKRIADDWLWGPTLVADVTLACRSEIGEQQCILSEDYHYLSWFNANGERDVIVEIRDGRSTLQVNIDLKRSKRQNLALHGICQKHGLTHMEFTGDMYG